jgi:hypothetical protein
MVKSNAATVQEYLEQLPPERRTVIEAVRTVLLQHLPAGYREAMNWGVINYEIPLEDFPDTYNGQPLTYVALAAQKNHFALYLMCAYGDGKHATWLADQFKKAGKKLDMGKSCLRFKKLDDLPLEVIGQLVARVTPEKYIAFYKASRAQASGGC